MSNSSHSPTKPTTDDHFIRKKTASIRIENAEVNLIATQSLVGTSDETFKRVLPRLQELAKEDLLSNRESPTKFLSIVEDITKRRCGTAYLRMDGHANRIRSYEISQIMGCNHYTCGSATPQLCQIDVTNGSQLATPIPYTYESLALATQCSAPAYVSTGGPTYRACWYSSK
jgi:hypothetical protein